MTSAGSMSGQGMLKPTSVFSGVEVFDEKGAFPIVPVDCINGSAGSAEAQKVLLNEQGEILNWLGEFLVFALNCTDFFVPSVSPD